MHNYNSKGWTPPWGSTPGGVAHPANTYKKYKTFNAIQRLGVDAPPGCPRELSTCQNLHNNDIKRTVYSKVKQHSQQGFPTKGGTHHAASKYLVKTLKGYKIKHK